MDAQSGEPLHWLAETKFHPPLLREDVITRQHLLGDLRNRLTSHPLTPLSAPAGYGKTTSLAALPATYPDLSLAWLSLDEADNNPARFLTVLIMALQHLNSTWLAPRSLPCSHTRKVGRWASVCWPVLSAA